MKIPLQAAPVFRHTNTTSMTIQSDLGVKPSIAFYEHPQLVCYQDQNCLGNHAPADTPADCCVDYGWKSYRDNNNICTNC
jgi:hypothetical protein